MKKIIEVLILIGGLMMVVSCVNPSSVSDDNETQNTNNTEVQNGGDNEIVATPTITLNNSTITITCATDGATIHYTTDGSEPTVTSPIYTNAIILTTTTTVKAIAVKEGMTNSSVATQNVIINTLVLNGTNIDKRSSCSYINYVSYFFQESNTKYITFRFNSNNNITYKITNVKINNNTFNITNRNINEYTYNNSQIKIDIANITNLSLEWVNLNNVTLVIQTN